jgi:hypothetical protein
MTKKNANANWAEKAYTAARNDIARLIDVLQMELERHDEKANPKTAAWAGNLQKVRSDLIDTVAFISGMEREEVERFLDEAE